MSVRINCINKAGGNHEDPHTAISFLGWVNEQNLESGKSSRLEMYEWIKQGGQAYVRDSYGNTIFVGTATTAFGTKYVRTYADRVWTDNLLSLPECQ
jgi:hypothetical protein